MRRFIGLSLGIARMVEHYAYLQEKYNDLEGKHRAIMEGIKEVKRAAAKAGKKGWDSLCQVTCS